MSVSMMAGKREISAELERRSGRKAQGFYVPHEIFEKRAITTGGSGGSLYPETHRPDLYIDRLRNKLRVLQLGATVLDGLVGDQDIPKLVTSVTGHWIDEHADTTQSDPVFGSAVLTPHTVSAQSEWSRRMAISG